MDLDYFIVSFIDILGFSQMVKNDCENKTENKYFEKLKSSYLLLRDKYKDDVDIKQFSDSIILSLSLSKENFIKAIDISRNIQADLFTKSILTRGGISFGKHYMESDFIFSEGLINSYILEKENAKNPRILISQDLFILYLNTDELLKSEKIIREDDRNYFVNYLNLVSLEECENVFMQIFKYDTNDYSIREKHRWLYEYGKYCFRDKLKIETNRFIDKNIIG